MFDTFNGLARWFDASGPLPLTVIADEYLSIFTQGIAAKGAIDKARGSIASATAGPAGGVRRSESTLRAAK